VKAMSQAYYTGIDVWLEMEIDEFVKWTKE
jgi:hypothetical protein